MVAPLVGAALVSGASSLIGGGMSLYGGRRQQTAANAQAAAQMQFERENMFHQNQVALDFAREQNAFSAGQALEARDWNAQQAGIERTFNAQEAAKNRDFQEYMSRTQYQRATEDMRSAGLNPMLAVSQGGAGNVSGSAASTSAPQTSAPSGAAASPSGLARGAQAQQFNYLASAVATAAQVGQMVAGVHQMNAQTDKTEAETEALRHLLGGKTQVDPKTGQVTVHGPGVLYRSQIDKAVSEAKTADSEARKRENEAKASEFSPRRAQLDTEIRAYDIPKAKADAAFEQLMFETLKESGSASGIERGLKLLLPLLMKGFSK